MSTDVDSNLRRRRFKGARALLVVVSAIAMVVAFELAMRRVKTSYSKKRAMLESRAERVEVLVTGASSSLFGIDPSKLGPDAVNVADVGQSLYYDRMILERYVDRLSRLRLVLLPIGTWGMETTLAKTREAWRWRFYSRYWEIPPPHPQPPLDPRRFSVAALFPPATRAKALFTFDLAHELDRNGFEVAPGTVVPRAAAEREYAIEKAVFSEANLAENAGELRAILDLLARKGVPAVIVVPPMNPAYFGLLDPDVRARDLAVIRDLTQEFHVTLVDYTTDPRFEEDAFLDVDHLNGVGAARFSTLLGEEVVKPALGATSAGAPQ